MIWSTT
jgi:hypothetical protein